MLYYIQFKRKEVNKLIEQIQMVVNLITSIINFITAIILIKQATKRKK
jgi:hypothetical protein